jgi:hypothetical protein
MDRLDQQRMRLALLPRGFPASEACWSSLGVP